MSIQFHGTSLSPPSPGAAKLPAPSAGQAATAAPTPTAVTAGSARLASMSDEQILAMIEKAATDPFVANEVMHLQKIAFESVNKAIQGMLGQLATLEPPGQKMDTTPMSVMALASAARQRESNGKQKREFAQNLIIGALLNKDNPNWNIFDQADLPPDAKNRNGILALLQMAPPMPAAPPRGHGGSE